MRPYERPGFFVGGLKTFLRECPFSQILTAACSAPALGVMTLIHMGQFFCCARLRGGFASAKGVFVWKDLQKNLCQPRGDRQRGQYVGQAYLRKVEQIQADADDQQPAQGRDFIE